MRLAITTLVLGFWILGTASAQWVPDGVVVCDEVQDQGAPVVAADGEGGAIVAWPDARETGDNDIYAQRVDSAGYARWAINGIALCDTTGNQGLPEIVSDGTGGAIVVWHDHRGSSWDIFAQRVDGDGNALWQEDGVAVCTFAGEQSYLDAVEDGQGGAIVTWSDYRRGEYDIYAQRLDADGAALWSSDGVPVCTASGWQEDPKITTDGWNGGVITWEDNRADYDIYAQRVDSSGVCLWSADGVSVCTAADRQEYPEITTDCAHGAIITWQDRRSGGLDIYSQRADSSGTASWQADGELMCTALGFQYYPRLVSDGIGGAIVVWGDSRNSIPDIYGQRVDSSGQVRWTPEGTAICDAPNEQQPPPGVDLITADGSGGAIVAWQDMRSNVNLDIYAQRMSHDGAALWDSNGVAVCLAWAAQAYPVPASTGGGGAIIAWIDGRNPGTDADIYAQKVDSAGVVGVKDVPEAQGRREDAVLVQHRPNPFSRQTEILFLVPTSPLPVSLRVYDIRGRLVRVLVDDEKEPGWHSTVWEGRDDGGREVGSGVYFYRLELGKWSDVRQVLRIRWR